MHEPTLEEIKKAINEASDDQLDFMFELEEHRKDDSVGVKIASSYGLNYSEMVIIDTWLKYLFLGLVPASYAMDHILADTSSEEEAVIAYALQIIDKTPLNLRQTIKSLGINKDIDTIFPGLFNGLAEAEENTPENTTNILRSLAKTNPGDDMSEVGISKSEVLAGIENPSETVKTPSFALPKTKPATTNILASLAQPATQESYAMPGTPDEDLKNIVDPFISQIGNSVNTPTSVNLKQDDTVAILEQALNPFESIKNAKESEDTKPISGPTLNSPAQKILENLDNKLNKVTGANSSESFKMVDTPRHDPYREAPEL